METLLAIETSGASLGVALIRDGAIVFEQNVIEGMVHGRALAPLMEQALRAGGVAPSELCCIAVSIGPGSWTGLRIGVSAAKTFAWAARISLVPVPSFEALALAASDASGGAATVVTLRDARSEGVFAAIFSVTARAPRRLLAECVLTPELFLRAADRISATGPWILCGDAKCMDALRPAAESRNWSVSGTCEHIPARALAESGWRRWRSGEGVLRDAASIHKLAPLYLRASDPELKLAERATVAH